MKYMYMILPFAILWASFGIVEWLDLVLSDEFEYINGTYVQTKYGEWYGVPYVITSFISFVGSIFLAIVKTVK